jgi:hypothetical protein
MVKTSRVVAQVVDTERIEEMVNTSTNTPQAADTASHGHRGQEQESPRSNAPFVRAQRQATGLPCTNSRGRAGCGGIPPCAAGESNTSDTAQR